MSTETISILKTLAERIQDFPIKTESESSLLSSIHSVLEGREIA